MPPDPGILTALLNQFVAVFSAGSGLLMGETRWIFFTITSVELTLAGLWWALRGENAIANLIQKLLMIGAFAYIVLNWGVLLTAVLNGFIWTGVTAGAMPPAAGMALIKNPSAIISQAFVVIDPIRAEVEGLTWLSIGKIIMLLVAELVTLIAFFILAIQVFLAYLEFHIVAALSLILVPFGIFKHTAFLAERAIGSVISFGVKLMVLSFIIAASTPIMLGLALPVDPNYQQAYCVMLGAMAIAFLAWQAPAIVSGMISGGPSLTAGSAAGFAAATALGAAGAVGGTLAAGRAVATAGVGATRAAATAAGAARTAGGLGAAAANISGSSAAVGALSGVGRAAAGAVRDVAGAPIRAVGASLRQAYAKGQVKAFAYTGGNAPGAVHARAAGSAGGTSAGTPTNRGAFQTAVQTARNLRAAIPPEAHPSGGIHAPIKHE